MENHPIIIEANTEQVILHAGFRFHPTNEELIIYYLVPKSLNVQFKAFAIGEADLRKMEPWELPWVANMGEEEWYFFCRTEKRYPTGQRTNRGTKSGYWKATGKDHEIYSGKILVGMKKTLVFYRGRAPKGVKSNWVMHEFRLDGKYSKDNLHESAQGKWVISRVFHKDSSGKKTHISALPDPNSQPEDVNPLPPLTDFSPGDCGLDIKSPSTPSHCQQPCSTPENPLSSSLPLPHFPDQLLIDENDFLDSLRAGSSNYASPGDGGGGGGGYFAGGISVDEYISSLLDV